ncbi:biotin--[acetyl-CoA-carboxylase] ligase [Flavobacterium sp. 14A]|uniref:biotin--[acetyl-CoA-carboxylase] ligase n=1 Tax=Flavobacterium sp. 14A TaxID=2735896 RepID=UPI00157007AE|nr:biotin--[acetyl-CoA-carboxylase] ligase [Flavobacterium sp. 14A]NRT11949.1 BirA family biotin operon repressor/biotin-[acetyl-CoA-carboxylase] ligase [Flavobacterium sp. 14A]
MKLIKLDAIDSTNDFLKGLANKQFVENFTVVTAEMQTKGKGQMGSVWQAEKGKNLTMSVLIKDVLLDLNQIYTLNIAVALAVIRALQFFKIPELSIKWPNDIMSYNYKIGGILIENSIKIDGSVNSVVGIGLNINQTNFENLPKGSSLAVIAKQEFDKQSVLLSIVKELKDAMIVLKTNPDSLWRDYLQLLFKKNLPMPFELPEGKRFMGIIKGVSMQGKLEILLEDDSIVTYNIKEIQMLY